MFAQFAKASAHAQCELARNFVRRTSSSKLRGTDPELIAAQDQQVSLKFSGILRWQVLAEPCNDSDLSLEDVQMLKQVWPPIDVGRIEIPGRKAS